MAICSYVARKNSEPVLVALLPQEQRGEDGDGGCRQRENGVRILSDVEPTMFSLVCVVCRCR